MSAPVPESRRWEFKEQAETLNFDTDTDKGNTPFAWHAPEDAT